MQACGYHVSLVLTHKSALSLPRTVFPLSVSISVSVSLCLFLFFPFPAFNSVPVSVPALSVYLPDSNTTPPPGFAHAGTCSMTAEKEA